MDHIYNSIFVFYLKPININLNPFPIHIELKENGSASEYIEQCIHETIQKLEENNITIDFITIDGDHKYDEINDDFFTIVFNLHKANYSFTEIISLLCENNIKHIQISDILYLQFDFIWSSNQ